MEQKVQNNNINMSIKRLVELCLHNSRNIKDIEEYGYSYENFTKEELIEITKLLFVEIKVRQDYIIELENKVSDIEHFLLDNNIDYDL